VVISELPFGVTIRMLDAWLPGAGPQPASGQAKMIHGHGDDTVMFFPHHCDIVHV